jgi:hypothetical protein
VAEETTEGRRRIPLYLVYQTQSRPQAQYHTTTMPTQRPFLANFLAAFRTHTPLPVHKTVSSPAATPAASLWTTTAAVSKPQPIPEPNTASAPRPINPKQSQPSQQTLHHNVHPSTHLPRSPPSPGPGQSQALSYGPSNKPQHSYPTCQESRRRRGSDSSSDSGGFRDVARVGAGEKWFIGGRTASGEEKYYKLSVVRRDRSADRISADQLSL